MERFGNIDTMQVLLVVILLLCGYLLVLIISQMGGLSFTFLALLILASFIGVIAFFHFVFKHYREISKGMLVLFLLYLLMISYVTVFSRRGRVQTDILLKFDSIEEALRRHSLEPLQHLWLNIAMFVPIGILFPAICPQRLDKLSCVLPLGMLLTTLIETTQLMLRIGQCDLEDMIANTLGACLGLLIFRLYGRFQYRA